MKVTYEDLKRVMEEALKEANVSGCAGAFSSPKAFKNTPSAPFLRKVSRPKRPSHTKMFDFLEER